MPLKLMYFFCLWSYRPAKYRCQINRNFILHQIPVVDNFFWNHNNVKNRFWYFRDNFRGEGVEEKIVHNLQTNPPCMSNLWVTLIFSCVKRKKIHAFKSLCPPTCLNVPQWDAMGTNIWFCIVSLWSEMHAINPILRCMPLTKLCFICWKYYPKFAKTNIWLWLQDEVTSPGGSTAAALRALELGGLRGTMMSAVSAAADRCRDMNN